MSGRDVYHRHIRILATATAMGMVIFTALALPAILSQAPVLNQWIALPLTIAFCGLPISLAPVARFGSIRAIRTIARIHTIVAPAFLLLWVPAMTVPSLPGGETPWVLNTISAVGATAILAWPTTVVWCYLPVIALGGGLLRFATRGSPDPVVAILDTVSIFTFAAVITAILLLVLHSGAVQDSALIRSIDQSRRTAEVESRARLRARLGTLVHDDIIATLVFAARADTSRSTAAASAAAALTSLASFARFDPRGDEAVSTHDAEVELRTAIGVVSEGVQVVGSLAACTQPLPRSTLSAIEGALLEAVRNAVRHGGPKVTIGVTLSATADRVVASVDDDGPGFLEEEIPQHRFGLRLSIIDRMHRVPGGSVVIESQPGRGTRVTLTWEAMS